ncbi:uncharacterized protein LOC109807108 [Cajanus cajan]|uniref:uncharacterized protein LOC109807108 n=1 Tax=Cajanus cajan TaxID=3821 RepID=UPI00098DC979|nr:uncharacterized protein LOC109807108 [Cajanus cajan]
MPFGLKNAGATYQRLMDKVFQQQIGRNMEVYVDDMVVKTLSAEAHVADLAEKPDHHSDLLLYLAVAESAISTVIVQEHHKVQIPIYFISRVLQDMEKRYQMIEKLALALVTAARHLQPYFQTHQVLVKTNYLIKQILRKSELARRMIAWSVELSEFGIKYESHGPLKAQYLADFVAELTPTSAEKQQVWTLHVDGSSNSKGGGASIILEGPNKVTIEQSLKFGFKVTNNQAEYEAFLNARADLLSKLANTKCPGKYWTIIQETLNLPSLDDKVVKASDSVERGWMTGIWNYLKEGTLFEDKDEARKMRVRSAKFIIIGNKLFKCGISTHLLKCLAEFQTTYVIEEIHRGICGMHYGALSMATKVLQAGYYWLTLKSDCQAYVQRCKECQQFGNVHRQPPEHLHQMMSPWPFA